MVTLPTLSQRPEAGEFARGKSAIMADFIKADREIRSAMAANGHLSMPGVAIEARFMGELDAKMKLSDLNAKITQGALERNEAIATTQQAYDLSVYAAAFETRKANAISALQAWLMDLKNQQAIDDETIARAAIQIDALRITLLEAKTAIELQLETINQQIATEDAKTAPYQVTLAHAKRDNATARLALIPVLQALLLAEQQTLSDKSAIYPLYTQFNTALKAVVDYRVANVFRSSRPMPARRRQTPTPRPHWPRQRRHSPQPMPRHWFSASAHCSRHSRLWWRHWPPLPTSNSPSLTR